MNKLVIVIILSFSSIGFGGYDYIITEGNFIGLTLQDQQTLLMTGGEGDILNLDDYSYAKILGTSPYSEYPTGGIRQVNLMGYSRLDFYGGDVFGLHIGTYSSVAIYGGNFHEIGSAQSAWKYEGQPPVLVPNPHIEMFIRDWDFDELTKQLTGTWGDFSTFDIKLIDVQGYSPTIENIKFTIIPEPLSLMLLALGGLIIRRNRL